MTDRKRALSADVNPAARDELTWQSDYAAQTDASGPHHTVTAPASR